MNEVEAFRLGFESGLEAGRAAARQELLDEILSGEWWPTSTAPERVPTTVVPELVRPADRQYAKAKTAAQIAREAEWSWSHSPGVSVRSPRAA
jgi:hypothetical protein